MSIVYLNGSFMNAAEASISPMDRGFLFADGVYEVVPVFNSRPLQMHEHLRRLERSLDELQIARPMTREQGAALFLEMIERNGGGDLAIYLQITRGAPGKRDHGFPVPPVTPTVFMTASSLGKTAVDDIANAAGAKAITAQDIRWLRCDIKSVALLASVLMRQRAVEAGAVETIMIRDGQVTEGSSTNVFVVTQQSIATPPLSPLILGGITRELVLDVARTLGLTVEEREIAAAELLAADEIWVTSATKDVLPIVNLDGKVLGNGRPGPVWKALAQSYLDYKRVVCVL
ncbi:MAG: D-amino acid aminotransferase [Pseudoxanthomonas sp.]